MHCKVVWALETGDGTDGHPCCLHEFLESDEFTMFFAGGPASAEQGEFAELLLPAGSPMPFECILLQVAVHGATRRGNAHADLQGWEVD